jgi:hypothetical protein
VPRKHKRRPEEPLQPLRRPQGEAPMWALVQWADVRRVSNEKPYRCPGCQLEIRPLVWHYVVVPQDDRRAPPPARGAVGAWPQPTRARRSDEI